MEEKEKTDAYWKKHLSHKLYEALRAGKMEEPNTGKYVNTTSDGIYLCAGCHSPVFSSKTKIDDGFGYAAFNITSNDKAVKLNSSYLANGDKYTEALCIACGGRLGIVSDGDLRTADDLDEGRQEYVVHANSNSIYLKTKFSKNKVTLFTGIFVLLIFIFGLYLLNFSTGVNLNNGDNIVHLQIANEEIYATAIDIDSIDLHESSYIFSKKALLIKYSHNENSPKLRPPKPSDILWLNGFYEVVYIEENTNEILNLPEDAMYALVISPGSLPQAHVGVSFENIIK